MKHNGSTKAGDENWETRMRMRLNMNMEILQKQIEMYDKYT